MSLVGQYKSKGMISGLPLTSTEGQFCAGCGGRCLCSPNTETNSSDRKKCFLLCFQAPGFLCWFRSATPHAISAKIHLALSLEALLPFSDPSWHLLTQNKVFSFTSSSRCVSLLFNLVKHFLQRHERMTINYLKFLGGLSSS